MLSWMLELFEKFASPLVAVLPDSPFRDLIISIDNSQALKWLNWFIPVATVLNIMKLWLGVISVFHLYKAVLRWLRLIQ